MITNVVSDLIERITGLALDRGGVNTALERFVTERMATLGMRRIDDYLALAADPTSPEQRMLIEAITVQHTWFYRDSEQLQTIARLLSAATPGPLSVWVAGCATGEEAYTLAIIGRRIGRELHVLATDVSQSALDIARRGVYGPAAVRDVPEIEKKWVPMRDGAYRVEPALKEHVTFQRHNLVEPPPIGPRGGWDLIVCRNVLIYFSPTAAMRLLERFARAIREGGSLVVGASEVVFEPPPGLELVSSGNRLVLRKPMRAHPPMMPSRLPTRLPTDGRDSREMRAVTPPPELRDAMRDSREMRAVTSSDPPTPVEIKPPQRLPRTGTEPMQALRAEAARKQEAKPAELRPEPRPERPERPERIELPRVEAAKNDPARLDGRGDPHDLVNGLSRAHALFERGEIVAALAQYEIMAERYPDIAEVWLFLGIARYTHGELDTAAKNLRASLCLDAALWPATFFLARSYEQLGLRAEALQQYDLIAVDDLQPPALRSESAVINELHAFRHDFRTAARRVSADRGVSLRRLFK